MTNTSAIRVRAYRALAAAGCGLFVLAACASLDAPPVTDTTVPAIPAALETFAVASLDDAADDPAIFIEPANPAASLILGTDKKAGLFVFGLDGEVRQFLEEGFLNNVDLRQSGAAGVAVASNRSDNTVALFTIAAGRVARTGSFPAQREEPYGICMAAGGQAGGYLVAVTHKGGEVDLFSFTRPDGSDARHLATTRLGGQLEGCVFDEPNGVLFVGEEEAGITRFTYQSDGALTAPFTVDQIGSETGIVADIEGLSLYRGAAPTQGYLVASVQGNNTYAVYDRAGETFLGRFSIGTSRDGSIDSVEETDGLDVTASALPGFPGGLLVVQDGFNGPGQQPQNFKLVDWRDVLGVLAVRVDDQS